MINSVPKYPLTDVHSTRLTFKYIAVNEPVHRHVEIEVASYAITWDRDLVNIWRKYHSVS